MADVNETTALIQALAPLCKRLGIRRVRVGELELEFGQTGDVNEEVIKRFQALIDKGMPTEEEALYWSTVGFAPTEGQQPGAPPVPRTARQRKADQ